jgi:hypothetical protein
MQRTAPPRSRAAVAVLIGLMALAASFSLWGVRRSLPDLPEMDETVLVMPAVSIASTGDLNPHRFDYPGSTLIYPLAAVLHVWQAAAHGGPWLAPSAELKELFKASLTPFFLAARLISIAYGLLCIPLVYAVGARVFDRTTGLVAAALLAVCPTFIDYASMARTDAAASFFYLALLWALLRLEQRPSTARQLQAGVLLGLGVATRYFVAAGAAALTAVEGLLIVGRRSRFGAVALCGIAAIATFLVATPYFALDFAGFRQAFTVQAEKQQSHLGADGLSPLGNLLWYLQSGVPTALGWAAARLAVLGLVLAGFRRERGMWLVVLHLVAFLAALCSLGVHWVRWLLPVLPLLALFAAYGIVGGLDLLAARVGFGRRAARLAAAAIALLLAIGPVRELAALGVLHSNPTTALVARDWIHANLPLGTAVAEEWYTAPIDPARYRVVALFSLAANPLAFYRLTGIKVLVVSGGIYGRYFAEPVRYAHEVAFYRELFEKGTLLQEFLPSETRGGGTIRVYRLD